MNPDAEAVTPNEAIFQLQEVPGPVFALKQQGDTVRLAAQTGRWSGTASDKTPTSGGFSGPGS